MFDGDGLLAGVDSFYSHAALLLLLEEIEPGRYRGVYGSLVYGFGDMLSWKSVIEETLAARDGRSRLKAVVVAMTAAEGRSFVAALRTGEAAIPMTDYRVSFRLGSHVTGFTMSLGSVFESPLDEPVQLLPNAHWRRRHHALEKRLRGKTLTLETLSSVVDALPANVPRRFRLLDIEQRLESLGDFDELFTPAVTFGVRGSSGVLEYTLVEQAVMPRASYRLAVRGGYGKMRADTAIFDVFPGAGTIVLGSNYDIVDYELYRDRVLVDGFLGSFLRTLVLNAAVAPPPVEIFLDRAGRDSVEISRAAPSFQTSVIGKPLAASPEPDVGAAARAWRRDLQEREEYVEHIFLADAATGRREGLLYLAQLVAAALRSAQAKQVNLIDTYGFDAHALLRIAAAAAKVPGGEIRLLTRNEPPPGSAASVDYEKLAKSVARRLGVTIRRWTPTRSIHDRYIWIGHRIWHVGHSFNQFGTDVSAVVEIRSVCAKAELVAFFESEFSRHCTVYP